MSKKLFFYCIIWLILSCNSYKKIGNTESQWLDIQIENLELPIHKMEGTRNNIWATDYGNGFLYKSEDRGKTWSKVIQFGSEYIEAIQFVDEDNGFICGDYGYVYKTTNNGRTWQEISPKIENRITERYRNDTTKNQKPDGIFSAYYKLHFLDKNEGFISGFLYNPKTGFRNSYQSLMFHTIDGGESWKKLTKEEKSIFMKNFIEHASPSFESINGVYYFDKNKSIETRRTKEGKDIVIHKNLKNNQQDTVFLPKSPYERPMLRNIVFFNLKKGYIFGGSLDDNQQKAIIYETSDGGKTWKYIQSAFPHIHATLLTENFLWITGKEGMIKRRKVRRNDEQPIDLFSR